MIIVDINQGTEEWFEEKLGKPSASNFSKILTPTGKKSTQRKGYLYQLVAERLTGQREESYSNDIMAEGVEREAKSRLAYEIIMGCEVNQAGCVYPNEKRRYLCSPDGLVGTPKPTYGLELKNVLGKTQVKYLLEGELPTKYIPQVQGSMLVTGLKRWDFMSYSPGMPPLIVEVKRDEEYISKLSEELDRFCSELEELAREIDNKELK